jgi:LPXTG-motif cell wall-anchored protein
MSRRVVCRVVKKLILAALAGFVGLGMTIAPAHAADDPYVASVATHCDSSGVQAVKRGNTVVTHVEVNANGNKTPKGTVRLTYDRIGGGFHATQSVRYAGHAIDVQSPALNKLGRYRVTTHFTPNDGSRFRACNGSYTLGVKANVNDNDDDNPPVNPSDDDGILPNTGGPDLLWLLLALALVGGGAGLVYVDRRRRRVPA